MAVNYDVDGVSYTSINAACTEIEASHNYNAGGSNMANVNVSITTADTTAVTVDAASAGTPGAAKHILIEATSGGHVGKWDATKQRLVVSSGAHAMTISEDFVQVKGLQIQQASTTDSAECIRLSSGVNDVIIEKCILDHSQTTSNQDGIYAGNYAVTDITVFDCVIKINSGNRAGIHAQNFSGSASQSWHIEHCTIDNDGQINSGEGSIVGNGASSGTTTLNVYNCYASGASSSAEDYEDQNTATWAGAGTISDDASATARFGVGSGNANNVTMVDSDTSGSIHLVTSLTAGSEDYQLVAATTGTNTAVDNAQTGGTRDSRLDITLDCAGNARPGTYTDRDCGAFEIAAAGGGGRIMSSLAHHGGLAGHGGIAGPGGGLAG